MSDDHLAILAAQFKAEIYDKLVHGSLCGTNRPWYDMALTWAMCNGHNVTEAVTTAITISHQIGSWK